MPIISTVANHISLGSEQCLTSTTFVSINLSSLPEGVYTELLTNTEVSMKATLPVKPYTAWILKKI